MENITHSHLPQLSSDHFNISNANPNVTTLSTVNPNNYNDNNSSNNLALSCKFDDLHNDENLNKNFVQISFSKSKHEDEHPLVKCEESGEACKVSNEEKDGGNGHCTRLVSYLYISYLLCRWGDRMWEFAVGLFMVEIWKKSLLLASLYGLVETAFVVSLGVIIGEYVDRFPRLKVIQTSLTLQNVCVFFATLSILLLLLQPWPSNGGGFLFFSCLVGLVNVLGGISALASLATKISLERDWIVIMAAEQPSNYLTKMNAVMRRIDLSCTLFAAIVVGLVMSTISIVASAMLIATWNITCVSIEYWLLLTIYNKTPRLHERKILYHLASQIDVVDTKAQLSTKPTQGKKITCKYDPFESDSNSFQQRPSEFCKNGTILWHKIWNLSIFEGWKIYLRQENMLAGISFSLLSLSVLSFGTLMTASLKWRGCPAYVLGLARGCAALIGICATLSYPLLHAKLQTLQAGMFSITLQWSFLTLCVVSIWIQNLKTSTIVLMIGAATARAGLWMFDLSITQLMQESVPEMERGVVAGVQTSMQSFFHLLTFVIGMIIPHPQDFGKLICMSFGSVTMAALVYALQVYHTCRNREKSFLFMRTLNR